MSDARSILPFPPGHNSTDTVVGGQHYDLTTLLYWNYTLYSNSTLSNTSNCYLAFSPFQPSLILANGTFINATTCYTPIKPIRERGITGLIFGTLFGLTIIPTLINLQKHGRTYLPRERRWQAVGRRWQWYWMLFVAASGIISTFTGVDVDRDYVLGLAMILQSFFYTLMVPGVLACVWEGVRHWGSWLQRQAYERDPFAMPQHDVRSRIESCMPLVFYGFDWLDFFLTIPRSWTPIQLQRSPEQTDSDARPAATDARVKAGAVMALCALCTICYCARHNLHYYYYYDDHQHHHSSPRSPIAKYTSIPPRLALAISLSTILTIYNLVSSTHFPISPYNASAGPGYLYGLGYAPALLILITNNTYGFLDDNEDRVLLRLRARQELAADRELGLWRGHDRASRKPAWWSRSRRPHPADEPLHRLRDMAGEIDGAPATATGAGAGDTEMETQSVSGGSGVHSTLGSTSAREGHDGQGGGSPWWTRPSGSVGSSSSRRGVVGQHPSSRTQGPSGLDASGKNKHKDLDEERNPETTRFVRRSSLLMPEAEAEEAKRKDTKGKKRRGSSFSSAAAPQSVKSMLDV